MRPSPGERVTIAERIPFPESQSSTGSGIKVSFAPGYGETEEEEYFQKL